jgi:hypothetical protein
MKIEYQKSDKLTKGQRGKSVLYRGERFTYNGI